MTAQRIPVGYWLAVTLAFLSHCANPVTKLRTEGSDPSQAGDDATKDDDPNAPGHHSFQSACVPTAIAGTKLSLSDPYCPKGTDGAEALGYLVDPAHNLAIDMSAFAVQGLADLVKRPANTKTKAVLVAAVVPQADLAEIFSGKSQNLVLKIRDVVDVVPNQAAALSAHYYYPKQSTLLVGLAEKKGGSIVLYQGAVENGKPASDRMPLWATFEGDSQIPRGFNFSAAVTITADNSEQGGASDTASLWNELSGCKPYGDTNYPFAKWCFAISRPTTSCVQACQNFGGIDGGKTAGLGDPNHTMWAPSCRTLLNLFMPPNTASSWSGSCGSWLTNGMTPAKGCYVSYGKGNTPDSRTAFDQGCDTLFGGDAYPDPLWGRICVCNGKS